jgi:hypothetical protein
LKNSVFWDVTPVAVVRTDVSEERSVIRLLVTANVPSSPILSTLMIEALSSSETSVVTRATRRNILDDDILHNYRRENLKSYIPENLVLAVFCLCFDSSKQRPKADICLSQIFVSFYLAETLPVLIMH